MESAEGFMFMYFHLESFGIRVLLSLIVCLLWVWNVLVGSVVVVRKLLSMKFYILVSYCCVGSMIMEFLLSACVIMALFPFSFVWMDLITFASGCILWVGFCSSNVLMRSATKFL